MSVAPHVGSKKRKKSDSKPYSQINKCLNEKRRREQENIHIEELAELVSASPSDMSSLSCKPDKCAILKETVNQIRTQKELNESELCNDLQQSEVSSSKPNIINNQVFGAILLEAIDGFIFVVDAEGKIEFVSDNILSFLNYTADEVNEKIIYHFIHPDDEAKFRSNLLLMMPLGNGRDWSSENSFISNKPTKHFNCRFLVKQEESEIKMENKSSPNPQYENLNITANFMPLDDGNTEPRNGLTCIARRVPFEEKRIGMNNVEQFTTRIDREGKVIDIDTSNLSQSSSQFLRKELKNSSMLDLCHPSDIATFKQHLKETFESGQATCVPYKFRIEEDKYAKIQTKSKVFSVEEYAVSTHSIIRDSESSVQDGLRNISSPSTASTSSGPESISDSSTSMNGSVVLSPMNINNSYGNYSSSLNTANNSEFGLSDLVLDIFPSSNWTLDPGSAQSKESDCTSVTSFVSSPQTAPLSNRSEISTIASPTNSAFVPNITSTNRGGSSVPSPAMQSRAPTPYGGSCFSPSASQSSSGRSPPPRALSAKSDSLNFSTTETPANNISQSVRPNQQLSNQKLRNLLTQNTDDSLLRQNMRPVTQEEVAALLGSRLLDNNNVSRSTINQNVSPPDNVILRDLLSQDDENSEDVPVEPIKKCIDSPVPNPLLNTGACKAGEKSSQQRQLGNNMLRKLLNNDDVEKNYRKTDIIHQLLVSNPGSKITLQNDKLKNESMTVPRSMEVPKQVSAESSRGISADVAFITENALKRKSNDRNSPSTAPKKPNNGTHLAGQNPMLASMLAQTPQTPPSVPTCVASAIMTRLPQERLPKNLEKKLVHTPITAISLSGTPTSTLTNTIAITSPSVQRDIVTSGGHVVQQSAQQIAIQSGLRHASFLQQQQHQGILDKILSTGNNEENIVIPRSLAISLSNMANPIQQNAASLAQLAPTVSDTIASTSFAQILNEATLVDVNSLSDAVPSNQIADLGFDALLDQIYSLREEHNVEIPRGSDDPQAILKLLGDTLDIPQTSTATRMANVPSAQEINEKIAISAIQKELEGTAAAIANRANQNAAVISTYSQAGRPLTNVSGTPVVHAQITQEQLLLLQQQQQQQQQLANSSLPPNYSLVTNRVRLPNSTQTNIINQNVLAQAQRRGVQVVRNVNIGSADLAMLRLQKNVKQRALLQQQKRLLDQQKQQQLSMQTQPLDVVTSPGSTNFTTENINDLMNNTVAPNVTLLRSSGIPEVPGSARFNLISANSLPSPNSQTSPTSAQLSPGQRVNQSSPFSPLAQQQQPFPSQTPPPTSYQAARLSPHPPPSYPQAATSHSSSPISSSASPLMVLSPQSTSTGSPQWNQRAATSPLQNLQLQNPMLNAQLSQQASIGAKGIHLTAQQKQLLRNLQASANAQNARNIVFTQQQQQQSDSNFNPVSPVMVLQTQASQQRIQRGRIPSGTQNQSNFSSNDPVLSPQSLPSPSFSQSLANTPTSAFVSISSPGIPVTYSLASGGQHFTFERQNIQVFTTSPSESLRSPACEQGTSDSLQAQLRIINTTQNQQLSNSLNQQILQSLTSSGSVTAARVVNVNSLSREALEELGLSVELLSAEAQPASQVLLSQALLSDSSSQENSSQSISPRVQPDEPKPDQKKSLLQQLLSEPT